MKRVILVIFTLVFCNQIVFSQSVTGEQRIFSLEECIEISLKNNPDLEVAKKRLDLAKSNSKAAFGAFLPSASVSAGYTRTLKERSDIPSADDLNYFNFNAGIDYNIFDGFSRSAQYDRAENQMISVKENYNYYLSYIKMNVYRLYVDVILKQQTIKIRKDNYETGRIEYEAAKARFEAGVIHEGILASQEAELANTEYQIVVAENDLNNSKASLLTMMGLPPNQTADFKESSLPLEINDALSNEAKSKFSNMEYSINEALKSRSDYLSSKANLEAAKNNIDIAKASYYPKLGLSLGWNWGNNQINYFEERSTSSLSLNFSYPIFDQFITENRVESAKFDILQTEMQLYQLEQNIRADIQKAYIYLESAQKQMEISERALNAAQKNYDISKQRFDTGAASITDYIVANNTLLTSKINRINAVYTYYLQLKEIEFSVYNLK